MTEIELDFDDLITALGRVDDELSRMMPIALQQAGDAIVSYAKENHDYTDRSSSLTNSIERDEVQGSWKSDDLTVDVAAGAPHAAHIEWGTRPHTIKPVHRKWLRWPVEGGYRFAKQVRHPGTTGYRYLRNALEAKVEDAAGEVEAVVELAFMNAGLG